MMLDDVREYRAAQGLVGKIAGDEHHVGESGALSSGRKPRYHLVPFSIFAPRLAARYAHGADKYGEDNWRRGLGDRDYVMDRANHTLEHLLQAIDNLNRGQEGSDDDLAAVIWGAIFLMGAQHELGIIEVDRV